MNMNWEASGRGSRPPAGGRKGRPYDSRLLRDRDRLDRDRTTEATLVVVSHDSGDLREERVVLAAADVHSRYELRSALTHEDGSTRHVLPAERLDAQALGIRVAAVAGGALTLLVCHGAAPLSFDCFDANLEHRLTVPLGAPVLLRALLLEHEDLAVADRAEHLGLHGDALQRLRADAHALIAGHQDHASARQREGLALGDLLARRLFNPDHVARGDLQLLAAGADDRVHKAR